MPQTAQVRGTATTVLTEDGMTKVIYHNTVVVKFNHEKIILDSGGWQTVTTKTRMTQAANQFDLGYSVYQKSHEWFVDFRGETLDFVDGMELERGEK